MALQMLLQERKSSFQTRTLGYLHRRAMEWAGSIGKLSPVPSGAFCILMCL